MITCRKSPRGTKLYRPNQNAYIKTVLTTFNQSITVCFAIAMDTNVHRQEAAIDLTTVRFLDKDNNSKCLMDKSGGDIAANR